MGRLMILSSDGHAVAPMEEFRDYLEPAYLGDFEEFLPVWREHGSSAVAEKSMRLRTDDEAVDVWSRDFLATGRTDGYFDPDRRIVEMDRNGLSGEVLFPDFGTPFALGSPTVAAMLGIKPSTPDQLEAGFRAHNRWAAQFVQVAPERFAPMAAISFRDVDAAVREIRWASDAGFRGILLPPVPDDAQLYDVRYEPVWSALEERGLVLNSHISLSAELPPFGAPPHRTTTVALLSLDAFNAVQRAFRVLVWGGVLERHPHLNVVFTEQHSDWVIPLLAKMDYSYEHSDLRKDIRSIVPRKPSEYWQRQCYLGSSIFSKAEVRERYSIGINKMMLGFDYPHFEGAWRLGSTAYLQSTLGAAAVPVAEARKILSETAAEVFGFDEAKLLAVADRVGPDAAEVLAPPVNPLVDADLDRPMMTVV
jgi:predicted TIM-barrel fold metal-dependent hydrolase